MLETHRRLRDARKSEEGDPIDEVADRIADEARLLAFDEMVVNNPADAMILSRLFEKLLDREVRVVRSGFRLASGDPEPKSPPPVLGADTQDLLAELGYSVDEAEALARAGAI